MDMNTPDLIVNYDENGDICYTLVFAVQYPGYLQPLHRNLALLVCTFDDKKLCGSYKIIQANFKP